jgi:predicted transcriptional regulator YheO
MALINVISIPTPNGTKTIEIHHDDITSLKWDFDILVLSAYRFGYAPTPNTIMKSLLDNMGLSVSDYARKPSIDLRESLNCWVSEIIPDSNFKRLLCVEGISDLLYLEGSSERVLSDLFATISLLSYKKISARSIAMPILGTGNQGSKVEDVLPILIEKTINALCTNIDLTTVYFVEKTEAKAQKIDTTINALLKRGTDKLEQVFSDGSVVELLQQVMSKLVQIQMTNREFAENRTFNNLIAKIQTEELRFFELGILCRKLLEILIPHISRIDSGKNVSLYEHVNELKSKNVAAWMITYMHTIRVFGNFVAHGDASDEFPAQMEKSDVVVFSHALNRFLDFFIGFQTISEKSLLKNQQANL